MVARSGQIQWRNNPNPILSESEHSPAVSPENNPPRNMDNDSSFRGDINTKKTERNSMDVRKSDKEKHLIEAIVFTADFLTCAQDSSTNTVSQWFCGTSSEEKTSDNSNSNNSYGKEEGWFGMKRQRLISYENAEELTRKVDALFHRNGTNSCRSICSDNLTQPSVALEIRDDHPMTKDHNGNNNGPRHNIRPDSLEETHHSKSPSMSNVLLWRPNMFTHLSRRA